MTTASGAIDIGTSLLTQSTNGVKASENDWQKLEEGEAENPWASTPDEILLHVLSFLEEDDLLNVASVCRHWHHYSQSPSLWKRLYLREPVIRLTKAYPNSDWKFLCKRRRELAELSRDSVLTIQQSKVVLVKQNGGKTVNLTFEDGYHQEPTFSPCGYRVVFSCAVRNPAAKFDSKIISCYVDGSDVTVCSLNSHPPPFYYYWSPNSRYIGWLSNFNDGITLQVVDVVEAPDQSIPLQTGRPLFFSWCPDSTQFIANVSREQLIIHRLVEDPNSPGKEKRMIWMPRTEDAPESSSKETISTSSSLRESTSSSLARSSTLSKSKETIKPFSILDCEAGEFGAPVWHPTLLRYVFFVIQENDTNVLVAYDMIDHEIALRFIKFPSCLKFEISPDGQQLAFWHGEDNPGPLYVYSIARFLSTPSRLQSASEPITIEEGLASGHIRLIHEKAFAFFWSPDSRSLSFLTNLTGQTIWLLFGLNYQWWRWDGEKSTQFGSPFMTTRFFHQILTYFDQYAQSLRLWDRSSTKVICEHQREVLIIDSANGVSTPLGEGFWAIFSPK